MIESGHMNKIIIGITLIAILLVPISLVVLAFGVIVTSCKAEVNTNPKDQSPKNQFENYPKTGYDYSKAYDLHYLPEIDNGTTICFIPKGFKFNAYMSDFAKRNNYVCIENDKEVRFYYVAHSKHDKSQLSYLFIYVDENK